MNRLTLSIVLTTLFALTLKAQDKKNNITYGELTELKGTEFVIIGVYKNAKFSSQTESLKILNTSTGQIKQLDFPVDNAIFKIEHLKLDSLGINNIILSARVTNRESGLTGIWNLPTKLFVCSIDGSEKTQITDDLFYVEDWVVNRQTGIIVISGFLDNDNDAKFNKKDKYEILLFDIKKMAIIKRI